MASPRGSGILKPDCRGFVYLFIDLSGFRVLLQLSCIGGNFEQALVG